MAVLALIVMLCVLYRPENSEKPAEKPEKIPEMEQVKQRIDRAYDLRTQLELIDNMIIDMELVKPEGPCVMRAVTMDYLTTAGKDAKVYIQFDGGETTQKLLEMLRAERANICTHLYSEIENIPKRYGQNDDKTAKMVMESLSFRDVVKRWTNQGRR